MYRIVYNKENNIIINTLWLCLSVALVSCGGMSDMQDYLGDGYSYLGTGRGQNLIYQSNNLAQPNTMDSIVTLPGVGAYRYNDDYILATQQPNKESITTRLSFHTGYIEAVAESIVNYDPFFTKMFLNEENYWIIDKRNQETHDPFSEEEYLNSGGEMGINSEFLHSIIIR